MKWKFLKLWPQTRSGIVMHRADLVKESAYGFLFLALITDFLLAQFQIFSVIFLPIL